jgi:hypothetical protein
MQTAAEREAHLRVLANQLFFVAEKTGQRFTLKRTTDEPKPVCEEGLTLTEAEQLLQRWKLRGFHGANCHLRPVANILETKFFYIHVTQTRVGSRATKKPKGRENLRTEPSYRL